MFFHRGEEMIIDSLPQRCIPLCSMNVVNHGEKKNHNGLLLIILALFTRIYVCDDVEA
jgi:hypothetical protein